MARDYRYEPPCDAKIRIVNPDGTLRDGSKRAKSMPNRATPDAWPNSDRAQKIKIVKAAKIIKYIIFAALIFLIFLGLILPDADSLTDIFERLIGVIIFGGWFWVLAILYLLGIAFEDFIEQKDETVRVVWWSFSMDFAAKPPPQEEKPGLKPTGRKTRPKKIATKKLATTGAARESPEK